MGEVVHTVRRVVHVAIHTAGRLASVPRCKHKLPSVAPSLSEVIHAPIEAIVGAR